MSIKKSVEIKKFNNFSNQNIVAVDKFYNCLPTDNKLLNCMGVGVAKLPYDVDDMTLYPLNTDKLNLESIDGVAYFKQFYKKSGNTQHKLLVYGSDKKVYLNQMFDQDMDLYWLYSLEFDSAPITLSYKKNDEDVIILASKEQMKIWKTGYSPYTVSDVPIITSMCMNDGVLFCTIQEPAFKVWYATDLDAENIGNISKNSGYISLEDDLGYARKIVTFDHDVFVFRDYGISKISFVKNNISVNQVYLSNTKILSNTVSVCGNIIMFMTNEGLHTFNGVKVSKTNVNIHDMLTGLNQNAVASSLGDKYYLAVKLDFEDNNKILCEQFDCINNALVVVDINDYSYQVVRGVDIKSLLPLKTEKIETMLCTFNTKDNKKLGQIQQGATSFDESLPKYWSSSDLVDNYKVKLFTKLTVKADINIKFNLIYDGKSISFTTYKTGLNEFCFKINCKQMRLEISSNDSSAQVDHVVLDYYEY
ncbi:MAG: hypothetical protein IKM43_02915 [Clostridia bacterium]|nr:hypothetical protein [Clostridia bacterium]